MLMFFVVSTVLRQFSLAALIRLTLVPVAAVFSFPRWFGSLSDAISQDHSNIVPWISKKQIGV